MATAPTRNGLGLPSLTGFLTLAPATSASYPTHRRTKSSPSVDNVAASTLVSPTPHAQATATAQSDPEEVVAEPVALAAVAAPIIPTSAEKELELKVRRSSSLSSEGSNGTARKLKFLRLGPVHHGEHVEGDGDWSEEIAIAE